MIEDYLDCEIDEDILQAGLILLQQSLQEDNLELLDFDKIDAISRAEDFVDRSKFLCFFKR